MVYEMMVRSNGGKIIWGKREDIILDQGTRKGVTEKVIFE